MEACSNKGFDIWRTHQPPCPGQDWSASVGACGTLPPNHVHSYAIAGYTAQVNLGSKQIKIFPCSRDTVKKGKNSCRSSTVGVAASRA